MLAARDRPATELTEASRPITLHCPPSFMLATVSLLALGASFTTPARYAVRHGARAATPACEAPKPPADLEAVTEKYGLEAGLFTALKERGSSGEGGGGAAEQGGAMASAGDLLKRYGGAYLLTSTSLALVSFSCIPT